MDVCMKSWPIWHDYPTWSYAGATLVIW
jgi:hypothetical protein